MEASDIRVALFSGNYNYVKDGANQALNLLVGYLLDRGVTARVYSPTTDTPAFPPTGDLVSVPSFPVPGGRDEYRFATGMSAEVRRDLEGFRPNIVHVSAPEMLGHAAVKWAHRHGVKSVASFHTRFETYFDYYGVGFVRPLILRIYRKFYNKFDLVMPPAKSMEDKLREWGVTTPIAYWSRGIDHDRFDPARRSLEWRRSLGIGDDEVAVGFLGRLVKEKGLDIFAEVTAELTRRGVAHKVLVVGKGPARDWFAAHAPHAIFAGFQAGDDLGRAVASMDMLFNPSVTEAFGNVTTEAHAAGVPVIGAIATGTIDIVQNGKTGFLVPPRDVTAYADAIQTLAQDADMRARFSAAAHESVRGYVWDTINQAVLDGYLRLLNDA